MAVFRLRAVPQIDWYLVLLMLMVAVGLFLPARGMWRPVVDSVAYWAVWLLFFLYGARLSMKAVWEGLIHWRLQGLVFASTYIVLPVLGIAAAAAASGWLQEDLRAGLIFLGLLPSTVQSSIAFTSIARGNVPAALCAASISNLLGVVITPVLASLLLTASVGFSMAGVEKIALQLVLPFALGQFAKPLLAGWLHRHRTVAMSVDRGSILVIVYSAFSAGTTAGIWALVSVVDLAVLALLTLAILATILVITTVLSRRLDFSKEDEIAIVFCGSKKSLASGLPLAKVLFPGPDLGLIMLPIMIFHQAQLLVCAGLARRYARRSTD